MTTRGERIRRELNVRRIPINDFAAELGTTRRTLSRILKDQTPNSRLIDVIEARLGINVGATAPGEAEASPPLNKATNAQILLELYHRLDQPALAREISEIPADAADDPDLILGPPSTRQDENERDTS